MASGISVFEVGVYLIGLSIVLQHLDSPTNIAAYCFGYGAGVYIGSRIEQALALGYINIQIIVDSVDCDLPNQLRKKGYGVTSWYAEGKDGMRIVLLVLAKRHNEKKLLELLNGICPSAFIVAYEPQNFVGGFWSKSIR